MGLQAAARPLTSPSKSRRGWTGGEQVEETEGLPQMKGWRSDAKSLNDLSKFEARWPFRSLLRLFHAPFSLSLE